MNTDKELLELAAKSIFQTFGLQMIEGGWNPLEDDGDALRLAVKLGFDVDIWSGKGITMVDCVNVVKNENHGNDPYAATRRAIVRAAAEIGKAL